MRTSILALAASALLMGAEAASVLRRHAHGHAHQDKRGLYESTPEETCAVVTYTTWVPYTAPTYATTETVQATVYVVPTNTSTSTTCSYTTVTPTYAYVVPTPEVTTCSPGTYTFPAKAVTVTSTAIVYVPTSTVLPSGTHTYGYTTQAITTETTVTVTYATVLTTASTVYTTATSTILECKTPGTYTVGGYTTTATETVTCTYPTLSSYAPGTYTHPASIVTATATQVYTCPYEKYVAPKPSTTAPASVSPGAGSYAVASPKPYAVASSSAAPASSPASYSGGTGSCSGKQWCITYTQYNNDNSCKSSSQIASDIALIASKGFRTVRIYAPDCGALEAVSEACSAHGLKIVVGVFFYAGDAGWSQTYSQITTICEWAQWDLVDLVVIGNESIYGGIISAADLATVIANARAQLRKAGWTGSITTCEVVGILQDNTALCPYIDVVAVNVQPYFNGGYAQDSGPFLQQQVGLASAACGGKKTYVLEAGWPNAGATYENSVPGIPEQQAAIESIHSIDEGCISYYTTFDDGWKSPTQNGGVEQHFGCAQLFPLSY